MEELTVRVGERHVKALRLQDLPANHVFAYMAAPEGVREMVAAKLFVLASGDQVDLGELTFAEVDSAVSDWVAESLETAGDEEGSGLDWSGLLP
ncbi:hypothetical protein SEA_CECE_286 [Microbacterium phage Cece]|nr:hypothetical protein SEA_CECE_286 [Microbacterium phage Cece]